MPAEQSTRGSGGSFWSVRRLQKLRGIATAIAGFIALAAVSPARADLYHQYCSRLQPSLRAACLAQYNYDVSHHVPIGP
jgi:hypothetical protein